MRLTAVAAGFVAILSFLAGSFLIFAITASWMINIDSFWSLELIAILSLGGLLVFLSLPIALFGLESLPRWLVDTSSISSEMTQDDIDNQSLFSNKRVMGLSFLITGADWLIFGLLGLWFSVRSFACLVNYPCGQILSYPASWILIAIGVAILSIGIILLAMSRFRSANNEMKARKAPLQSVGPSPHSAR